MGTQDKNYGEKKQSSQPKNPLYGVQNFLNKRNIDEADHEGVMRLYAAEIGIATTASLKEIAEEIQNDFGKFVKYCNKNL